MVQCGSTLPKLRLLRSSNQEGLIAVPRRRWKEIGVACSVAARECLVGRPACGRLLLATKWVCYS